MLKYKKTDTIVISDVHLGSMGSQAEKLYHFLDGLLQAPLNRLIIAGDLFELWSTNYKDIDKYEYKVARKIVELSERGTKVVYIPGNHDRAFRVFERFTMGKIKIRNEYLIKDNHKKYIVMHGDEFDAFTRNHVVVTLLVDQLYVLLIKWSALLKRYFNLGSSMAERKTSATYMKLVLKVRKAALTYAQSREVDGIIIGHTHHPEMFTNEEGIVYANAGDWMDSCSYVVISDEARLEYYVC
ncbi:MAG: UDP-2,3-diacylglucosamine diphosphatase [Parcubacteria group bacterium]|jgi:UDP-2,3-diacylglucosamine pyrophosphatase LpxH